MTLLSQFGLSAFHFFLTYFNLFSGHNTIESANFLHVLQEKIEQSEKKNPKPYHQ